MVLDEPKLQVKTFNFFTLQISARLHVCGFSCNRQKICQIQIFGLQASFK